MTDFALLESQKLIWRKICVIEKSWNFHTVHPVPEKWTSKILLINLDFQEFLAKISQFHNFAQYIPKISVVGDFTEKKNNVVVFKSKCEATLTTKTVLVTITSLLFSCTVWKFFQKSGKIFVKSQITVWKVQNLTLMIFWPKIPWNQLIPNSEEIS